MRSHPSHCSGREDLDTSLQRPTRQFTAAELGAVAHLYRGEVYRSTIWRTRLDNTTNWSVVTLGVALSITFSNATASPVPLLLVGFLVLFFLVLEARRYRYFNVWRARPLDREASLRAHARPGRAAPGRDLAADPGA